MCDKKNSVLFNDTECIVLSPNFKLTDESQVLLKVPRKNNMYSVDLKNIVPKGGLTCLFAKSTSDESKLWHRRLGHLNFKTMNKLVKGNLVRDTKDETSGIVKSFITRVENLIDQRVKVIMCDNGTEFKNKEMNRFCKRKGIKREFSVARTPQQNRVAERKNRILIEAARTMLADSKLPTTFWAVAVNTACYVQNREVDQIGFFDIDALTKSMNYKPVVAGNQSIGNAGTKACDDAGKARMKSVPGKNYILLPLWTADLSFSQISKSSPDAGFKPSSDDVKKVDEDSRNSEGIDQREIASFGYIVYSDDVDDVGAEAVMGIIWMIYACQVYKVEKATYGLRIQVPRASGELTILLGMQVKAGGGWNFFQSRQFVTEILMNLVLVMSRQQYHLWKSQKLLLKDEDGEVVECSVYRLMIGSIDLYLILLEQAKKDVRLIMEKLVIRENRQSDLVRKRIERKRIRVNAGDSKLMLLGITYNCWLFEQIVDFLNAHPIKYALTVKPIIYTSCIEQFWSTAKAKMVNREVQLQALVDGNKIIVTEASIRSDLQLDDEEGMDCLQNATIFEELTRMASKTTAWNEFSSTMASAIICLATNQKFIFSKYIFEIMVKNLENVSGKILMYPRNIKREGKGFSGRVTPLFTMVVKAQEEMGEGLANPTNPHHTPTIIQPSISQPQKKQRSRRSKRKDTKVPQPSGPTTNVADEAVNKEMDDSFERVATTATSLDAEQDRGNINKTQSKVIPNEPSSSGTSLGGGPRRQETMGDTIAQTRSENVSKLSNDPLLVRGNILQSGEDSLKLQELMELCTNLQNRVIDLEKTKTSQAQEITSLKLRVKKLEKKGGLSTHKLKRLYTGRIADIDADAGINLVSTHFDADTDMFGVHDLVGDEVVVESEVAIKAASTIPVSAATTTTTVITDDEITLAKALAELKSAKLPTTTAATIITAASTRPKAKGIVIHEQEQAPTPTVSSQQPSQLNV
ncbi:reverse transcriptase [Tanacetum coccineum]|uniref:Reverse transcriptase n=1 Tax=Tanacetum coccineum TaxID=301880 RepID=A0ABQ4YHI5_9ASTR